MKARISTVLAMLIGAAVGCVETPPPIETQDVVVLLHGLGRSDLSMLRIQLVLKDYGYKLVNLSYPSTSHSIDYLAEGVLGPALTACCATADGKIHFVTHSMGGIVLRYYLARHELPNLGRVVMLSPPNQGSEIADWLAENSMLENLLGPSAEELGTDSASVPNQLGPVDFELGIIAGNRTLNPLFSRMIPGPDDGKVAVERTKVEGMADFIVVPHSHTYIMLSEQVITQVAHFLQNGRFRHEDAGPSDTNAEPRSAAEESEGAGDHPVEGSNHP